jgi:hypothetical protein
MSKCEEVIEYALSDSDLRKLLGDDIKIVIYPELENVNDIEEVFDNKGRCMVLFLTENENTGHWLCLHLDGEEIHYFDPYGNGVDKNRSWLSRAKLIELNEDQPFLRKLLLQSGKKVYYNDFPFQEDRNDINTCGRHCATRLLYKDLDLDDYYNMIKESNLTPDEFVSNITYEILNK